MQPSSPGKSPNNKQSFVLSKHIKKLFREPGPIRPIDAFSQSVPLGHPAAFMNGGPIAVAPMAPFQTHSQTLYQQESKSPPHPVVPFDVKLGDPMKGDMPIRTPYPETFSRTPARSSLDQLQNQRVDDQTFQEGENPKSWTKRVFSPFSKMRKQRNQLQQNPLTSLEGNSGVFYHHPNQNKHQNDSLTNLYNESPYPPYPPHPPRKTSPKRKPLPTRGASLDSQLPNVFATPSDIAVGNNNSGTPRESSLRYSLDDIHKVVIRGPPQAVYMRSGFSSQQREEENQVESAEPRQSAMLLGLRNSNFTQNSLGLHSVPKQNFFEMREQDQPVTAQWSSTTLSQAEIDRFPIFQPVENQFQQQQYLRQQYVRQNQQGKTQPFVEKTKLQNPLEHSIQHVDDDISNSNPSEVNECLAKAYANRKFEEWIARTPDVNIYPGASNSLTRNVSVRHPRMINQGTPHQFERIQLEDKPMKEVFTKPLSILTAEQREQGKKTKVDRRTSSTSPVDPFELELRLSDLIESGRISNGLQRSSFQNKAMNKKSSTTMGRGLAAKLMSETPSKSGMLNMVVQGQEKETQEDVQQNKKIDAATSTLEIPITNLTGNTAVTKEKLHQRCEYQEKCCSALSFDVIQKASEQTLAALPSSDAHGQLQPRHWRSNEVIFQGSHIEKQPCLSNRKTLRREKEEPIEEDEIDIVSDEELELLSRVQTWRSCVAIMPKKKLYAPSASATDPSTTTVLRNLHSSGNDRASEWTSISRRVENGLKDNETVRVQDKRGEKENELPQVKKIFLDERNHKEMKGALQINDPPASPTQNVSPGTAHISFQGPPSELVKFFKGSMSLHNEQQQQQKQQQKTQVDHMHGAHGNLIDLNTPIGSQAPKKIQFGTKHIRQMSESDSKRFFDLLGDKFDTNLKNTVNDQKDEKPFLANSEKEIKTKKIKVEQELAKDNDKKNKKIYQYEAKVWEMLHKVDENGITGIERLLNARADELKDYLRNNKDAQRLSNFNIHNNKKEEKHFKNSPKRNNHLMTTKPIQTKITTIDYDGDDEHSPFKRRTPDTTENQDDPEMKGRNDDKDTSSKTVLQNECNEMYENEHEQDINATNNNVGDETVESALLQNILDYVQGAGDISQLHNTLITMHKDLLERTTDPIERKTIDQRLSNLEKAVFIPN